ncbi:MAG: bifunctional DNA-formamidopyrimidine glycosylase/DNA-(apurinic or apyrimidinic site) lyase [Vulcanimicrobiota bacterium]
MPELPEVETVRRSIAERIRGRRIERVVVRDNYVLRGQQVSRFIEGLEGQTFSESCRHGKLLFFPLPKLTLCIHLGMTGQLTVRLPHRADTPFQIQPRTGLQRALQHPPDKHTHISMELDDGSGLHYRDIRKFGRVFWIPLEGREAVIRHFNLGVDPLTPEFSLQYLKAGLKNRRVAVKAALLDQKFLAGLGNIYVDEALFLSGIRPGRGSYRVSGRMLEALYRAIVCVLEKGIEAGGTTLRDFINADGESGYNQEGLLVYGRYGESCPGCGKTLRRGLFAGRTTTWCANCQD